MSLFRSSIRPPAILSDEAIERYIASIRLQIDPDPLFRRRLRGIVVNGYVAAREGIAPAHPPRGMGRLGRACLHASFVLGLSVTSVMAASESAVPGDLLYALKRQIEHLRVEVLPADYHGVLAAYTLSERISELEVLVDRGDWARAEGLAPVVADELETLIEVGVVDRVTLDPQLSVLVSLVDRLPEPARAALGHALEASTGAPGPSAPSTPDGGGASGGSPGGGPDAGEGGPAGDRPSPGQPGTAGNGTELPIADPAEQGGAPASPEAIGPPSGGNPEPSARPSLPPTPSKSPKP